MSHTPGSSTSSSSTESTTKCAAGLETSWMDGPNESCWTVCSRRRQMWIPVSHRAQCLGRYFFSCSSTTLPPISTPGQESDSLLMIASIIYRAIHSIQDQILLQQDLDTLQSWSPTWVMKFNPSKWNILRTRQGLKGTLNRFYQLHGQILAEVPTAKYLGVNISNNLSWTPHVDYVVKKANQKLGFLRHNLPGSPVSSKCLAYTSLVQVWTWVRRPHLGSHNRQGLLEDWVDPEESCSLGQVNILPPAPASQSYCRS